MHEFILMRLSSNKKRVIIQLISVGNETLKNKNQPS